MRTIYFSVLCFLLAVFQSAAAPANTNRVVTYQPSTLAVTPSNLFGANILKGSGVSFATNSLGRITISATGGGGGGSQTPWESAIDAAGFDLTGLGQIDFNGGSSVSSVGSVLLTTALRVNGDFRADENSTILGTNFINRLWATNTANFLGAVNVAGAFGAATVRATNTLTIPNGIAPTTDTFGQLAADNNAWASSRGALQFFDGTANTYGVGVLASDTPGNGQVPKWNTGGTITWEDDATGAGGGDAVLVNGTGATDADLTNSTDILWSVSGSSPTKISGAVSNALTRDTEWDTAAEINAATSDDDFLTLTGVETASGAKSFTAAASFSALVSADSQRTTNAARFDGAVSLGSSLAGNTAKFTNETTHLGATTNHASARITNEFNGGWSHTVGLSTNVGVHRQVGNAHFSNDVTVAGGISAVSAQVSGDLTVGGTATIAAIAGAVTNRMVFTNAMAEAKTAFLRTDGSDATGTLGRRDKPFATFSNAVASLPVGGRLQVGPGSFYGNTTVTLLSGTSIVGAGPDVTTIQIDANVLFTDGVRVTNNCYLADFTMLSTNVTGTYMVPFRVSNATNVLFRNVRINAYYDGIIGDGGNSSLTLDRVDINTGYDCINIATWNTNSLFEVYSCKFVADATKGPTPAADSRAIYSVLSRVKGFGSSFATRNLSTSTTLEIIPHADFPPEFYGCEIDGGIGEAVSDNWQCVLDLNTFECTNYTYAAWKFVSCELKGKMSIGPYSGIYGGYDYRRYNIGAENFFTNAVRNSFTIGNSNYIGEATNLAAVGFTLTNRTTGTLDIGVSNATKTTFSHNKVDVRTAANISGRLSVDNIITTNAITVNIVTNSGVLYQEGASFFDVLNTATFDGAVDFNSSVDLGGSAFATTFSAGGLTSSDSLRVTNASRLDGAVTAGSTVSVGSLTSTGAVSVGMGVSTNVAQINLYETNRTRFWRLQGPDALTNDFIVIPPTNHPTAGQVMSVRAYAGNTVSLTWSNDASGGGGSGTNAASFQVTNFFGFWAQTNALAGAGTTNLVIDGRQAALVRCVPGANFGLLLTNLVDGQEITVEVKQDSTGIRTMAIPNYGNVKFGTDITGMTLSTNAAYIDVMKIKVRNTNALIVGFVRGYQE